MSNSETEGRPTGRLSVTAPIGVELEISDSAFRKLYAGAAPFEQDLPQGLYNVIWSAGGRSEDRTVRVKAGELCAEHGGHFPLGAAPPSSATNASPLEKDQFESTARLVRRDRRPGEAEVMVFIRSSNERPNSDLGRSIRLYDANGERMGCKIGEDEAFGNEEHQLAVRCYGGEAGRYTLRFETNERRIVEQSLFAFAGRRSLVFLKYGSALIPHLAKGAVRYAPRRGIEPTKTTIVSMPLDQQQDDFEEGSRIADILLHKLSEGEELADEALIDMLRRPEADPYLRIYAAALLLTARGRTESAAFEKAIKPESRAAAELLLEELDESCPDVMCIRWRMSMLDGSRGESGTPLDQPPMLDICWRWAAAYSVFAPWMIADTPAMQAAAQVTTPSPPWLVWKNRLERKEERPTTTPGDQELADRISQLAEIVIQRMASQNERRWLAPGPGNEILQLSPLTVELANAAVSAVPETSQYGQIDTQYLVEKVAFETGTPAADLSLQLDQAIQEFGSLNVKY